MRCQSPLMYLAGAGANDLPFARHLGVPYEDFVLNIQPDDYMQLNAKVQHILDSPKQLRPHAGDRHSHFSHMPLPPIRGLCFHEAVSAEGTAM